MSEESIARYYDEAKNPNGGYFGGVPLRDMTEAEYEALTPIEQRWVDGSGLFRKTKPRGASVHETPAQKEG